MKKLLSCHLYTHKTGLLHHNDPYIRVSITQKSLSGYVLTPNSFFPSHAPLSPTASCKPWEGTSVPRTRTVSTPSATTSTSWLWILRRLLRWSHRSVFFFFFIILTFACFDFGEKCPRPEVISSFFYFFCTINSQKISNLQLRET